MRNFVNRYIAEENEKFTKDEFGFAVVVTCILSALLFACCVF